VPGADVEDWGTLLITFDDGTVAQITGGDTVLGGIRNQLAVYAARAVVLCNINPNDSVQAYAPDAAVFSDEYLVVKLATKAGWSAPQPDEDWVTGYPLEIQDFVEAIAHGREPLSGVQLARDAGRATARSSRPRRRRVTVPTGRPAGDVSALRH
jgi:predicted dehydrogenase